MKYLLLLLIFVGCSKRAVNCSSTRVTGGVEISCPNQPTTKVEDGTSIKGDSGKDAESCSVTGSSAGAVVTCPNSEPVLIENGAIGPKGDPAEISDVDPCPANTGGVSGHQERFLCINDALYAVYYAPPYSFLTRLKDGVNYVTTDNRSCSFTVVQGCQIQ
jgi:hypothetical protein